MGASRKRKRSSAATQAVIRIPSSESSDSDSNEVKKKKQNARDSGHSSTTKDSDSSSSSESITFKKKKMQTPKSILKQMVPSSEELEYRKEKTKNKHEVEMYSKKFSCTKCNISFQPLIEKQKKVTAHPLMGVLMCEECCNYYGDGNFSLDSDNEDKYCRWCGEGGTLFTCSKCICGFCHKCIERHFGKDMVKKVKNEDDWCCYFCNPKPLWNLRLICSLAKNATQKVKTPKKNVDSTVKLDKTKTMLKMSNSSKKLMIEEKTSEESDCNGIETPFKTSPKNKNKSLGSPRGRRKEQSIESTDESENDEEEMKVKRRRKKCKNRHSGSGKRRKSSEKEDEEESEKEDETFESKRLHIIEKLENILKLTEYQMGFGMNWSTKKIRLLSSGNPLRSRKRLKKECQKVKWFISFLTSYLVGFGNSVAMLEKEISDDEVELVDEAPPPSNNSYDPILKFFGFVKNQIDVFNQKGIELEDLLGLEVYEDEIVLGLKKKREDGSDKKKPTLQPLSIDANVEKVAEEVTLKTPSDNSSGLESEGEKIVQEVNTLQDDIQKIITILKDD